MADSALLEHAPYADAGLGATLASDVDASAEAAAMPQEGEEQVEGEQGEGLSGGVGEEGQEDTDTTTGRRCGGWGVSVAHPAVLRPCAVLARRMLDCGAFSAACAP